MGTNNKKKTIKDIKGLDKAHPYSRKAVQMKRAILRQATGSQKEVIRHEPRKRAIDKLMWFKEQLPTSNEMSMEQIHEILEKYIQRNSTEIQEIKKTLRPGRPKPNRLDLLETLREKELQDYKVGMDMPDLSLPENVQLLREWDGQYGSITRIKTTRVKRPVEKSDEMQM
jgi:translation machinery-associated protein 16